MTNEKLKYDVPFVMINNEIFMSEKLTIYQMGIYCILCTYASNFDKSCFPSYSTIAKKAGCSRKKAITTVTELIELGLVTKQEQHNLKGENISNIYTIHTYPQKNVDKTENSSVPDTPPSEYDTSPSVSGTPKLNVDNYIKFNNNYNNQSISESEELKKILDNCDIDRLYEEKDRNLFIQAIETMYFSKEINVCGIAYPQSEVREKIKMLKYEVIAFAYDTLQYLECPPKSPINYLISVLYRGIFEAYN